MKLRAIALKKCAFCGAQGKLSEEHVFADWLDPYLPPSLGGHTTSHNAYGFDISQHPQASTLSLLDRKMDKGLLHKKGRAMKKNTLKIVCKPCNNNWMSRLQDQAKPILVPMLGGEWPAEMSQWNRRILAAWAVMFTMVVEFAHPETQATTFTDRDRLRLSPEPPLGWYVWIGLHNGPLWKIGFNHFGWSGAQFFQGTDEELRLATAALTAAPKDAQSTGWLVGPLYFQTFSSNVPDFTVDPIVFANTHGLANLWPINDLPVLRPHKVMDDIDADAASAALLPPLNRLGIRKAWEVLR